MEVCSEDKQLNKIDEPNIKFDCSCCGACCRTIKCRFLTEDNKCEIYDKRPVMCSVYRMWRITGGSLVSSWVDYIELQKAFCEFLRQRRKNGQKNK